MKGRRRGREKKKKLDLSDSSISKQKSPEKKQEKDEENRKGEGIAGGGLRRLPNLIGLGGDSKRLWVSWRHAVLAVSEL